MSNLCVLDNNRQHITSIGYVAIPALYTCHAH